MLLRLVCSAAFVLAGQAAIPQALAPNVRSALDKIKPANLKGDLSFLASDALQGRYTPSPGLDAAAEFIAGQFRAIGLQPAGDHDYFQTADLVDRKPLSLPGDLRVVIEGSPKSIQGASTLVLQAPRAVEFTAIAALVVSDRDPALLSGKDLHGKIVVAPLRRSSGPRGRVVEFDRLLANGGTAGEILVGSTNRSNRPRLIDSKQAARESFPVIVADSSDLQDWVKHPDWAGTISAAVPALPDQAVVAKNVLGMLPGSDPQLRGTYVLVTAHYDHIGTADTGRSMTTQKVANSQDHIFNGANDDGSGTVSVIEIARGLASLRPRPRRSIVFMTFFGEERGDIGSTYYGEHPVFPIAETIADLNLEQVGRIDSTKGRQVNSASLTGFDYSDVVGYVERAGKQTGIKIYMDKEASDDYFDRSDNAALALQGVPAHTLCVAFDYPDYHGLDDTWDKIDYENMARVDRTVALALIRMANSAKAPQWNASNSKTETFRTARPGT